MSKSSSLSNTILKSVSIRVLIVIVISSTLSYVHLYNTIERGMKDTLQKYVAERVKREEYLFLLAQANHDILKAETIKRFNQKISASELLRFDRLLRRLPDGTIRNKKEIYDGTQSAGVFIPANVKITNDLKHRVISMIDLTETYGKAFRSKFQDTYFTTSENIMVLYWPEVPNWTLEMKPDFNMLTEEYVWVVDRKHNPTRKSAWTGSFYDKVGKTWMTSLETPIEGKDWSVILGHDVMLTEFVARISSEHLKGTYNMIFRDDGRLITHPTLLTDIEKNEGKLNLQETNDNFLKEIYRTVTHAKQQQSDLPKIIEDSKGKNLLAFSKMGGHGWNFVTVFPTSLITSTTLSGIMFIIVLALVSLAFEIAFLYFGLKHDVIAPLRMLEESVTRISRGEYQARLEVNRTDELGQLAKSFNSMAQQIYDNERLLLQKVEERTKIVDEQRIVLIQKSKLASLGQMAGGIAHEINTPLAIIGLNIEQVNESIDEGNLDLEELKSSMLVIKETTDRIAKIISGLRFVARDGSKLSMEDANLDTIIEETLSFSTERIRLRHIDLEIIKKFDKELTINCRAVEISQVLINLLNNSTDAINSQKEKWIKLIINDLGNEVEISVVDSGPGIPADLHEKIMQPFFTTKDFGKGTGLGLSISYGIIESHGGRLFIDSTSPNTKFTIILPKNK